MTLGWSWRRKGYRNSLRWGKSCFYRRYPQRFICNHSFLQQKEYVGKPVLTQKGRLVPFTQILSKDSYPLWHNRRHQLMETEWRPSAVPLIGEELVSPLLVLEGKIVPSNWIPGTNHFRIIHNLLGAVEDTILSRRTCNRLWYLQNSWWERCFACRVHLVYGEDLPLAQHYFTSIAREHSLKRLLANFEEKTIGISATHMFFF